jgi:hypothetical protein
MTAIAQQVVTPEIRDPNCVSETLSNGPINMSVMGNFATLTFTQVRPNVGQLFEGKVDVKNLTAVVVSRITMPVESLIQFKTMLDHSVMNVGTVNSPTLKQ